MSLLGKYKIDFEDLKRHHSKESIAWLVSCLDPFHDYQYALEGKPDNRTGQSAVQMHNQSITLGAPASAAGGNWEASIAYTGLMNIIGQQYNVKAPTDVNTESVSYDHSLTGLGNGCITIQTRADTANFSAYTYAAGDTSQGVGLCQSNSTGRARLLVVGVEVHNVTASINKQGTVTSSQLPPPNDSVMTQTYVDVNATPWEDMATKAYKPPNLASSSSALLAVPGANQWEAAAGSYMISRDASQTDELLDSDVGATVAFRYGGENPGACVPHSNTTRDTRAYPHWYSSCRTGHVPFQIIYDGLSNSSTLKVTIRSIVEYFPDITASLLPGITPSPAYDPSILELYAKIITEAPYCVKVGENAGGGYFRKILKLIDNYIPKVAPLLGAYGKPILLAHSAGHMAANIATSSKKKKKAPLGQKKMTGQSGVSARQVSR